MVFVSVLLVFLLELQVMILLLSAWAQQAAPLHFCGKDYDFVVVIRYNLYILKILPLM